MSYWHRYYRPDLLGWKVTRISDPSGVPQQDVIWLESEPSNLDPTKMFYIEIDPNLAPAITITQNLPGVAGGDAGATYVPGGDTFSATVEVSGGVPPFSYQWYKFSGGSGTAITTAQNPTAKSKTFQITNYSAASAPGAGNGDWYVEITDSIGQKVTSERVRTKQAIAFSTNLNPTATWTAGTSASLTVAVNTNTGFAPYSYQWQKLNGSTWTNIAGATSATYTVASPTAADAGQYRCIATSSNTNPPKTVTSISCTVTVNPAA